MVSATISVLGVDLGKTVCGVVGLDASGAVVRRRKMRRETRPYEAVLEFKVLSRKIAFKQSLTSRGSTPLVSYVFEPGHGVSWFRGLSHLG